MKLSLLLIKGLSAFSRKTLCHEFCVATADDSGYGGRDI